MGRKGLALLLVGAMSFGGCPGVPTETSRTDDFYYLHRVDYFEELPGARNFEDILEICDGSITCLQEASQQHQKFREEICDAICDEVQQRYGEQMGEEELKHFMQEQREWCELGLGGIVY